MKQKNKSKININNNIKIKENKKSIDIKDLMNMDLKTLKTKFSKSLKNTKKLSNPEKKKKVVAFDMGSSIIKIVEGTYYKNDLTINKYIKIKTPKNAILDGEIKKEEELYSKLSEVLKANGIKTKFATCTSNSTSIINREILIPKVEEDEIETVVRFEIQQYLPINLDDYILQVILLGDEVIDGINKLNVRVIAYPEKIVKGYYNLLLNLDLKPYVLDVNYNAVNKFINYTGINNDFENNSNGTVAFIDMGASFIDVNIYKEGKLDFTRIIKAGGNDIDEVLLHSSGINSVIETDFKLGNINIEEDSNYINSQVRDVVDEWIDKIEKIIQFYKNRNIGNEVDNIVIFGGSSKIKGMEEYLSNKLGIKTRRKGISKMAFKSNDDGKPIDDFINVIGSVIRI